MYKQILMVLLIGAVLFQLTLMVVLLRTNRPIRMKSIGKLLQAQPREMCRYPSHTRQLQLELESKSLLSGTAEEKVFKILRWVMSLTDKVENNPGTSGWELLQYAKQGKGFLCGNLAQLFKEALSIAGINARTIIIKQAIFKVYNTHVTTEVFLYGKWRMFDPTFHMLYKNNLGEIVGISEIQAWHLSKKGLPVHQEFLGEVLYPIRIESYYISYESLLNYVFVCQKTNIRKYQAVISNTPPTTWFYEKHAQIKQWPIYAYRFLCTMALRVMPIVIVVLLLAQGIFYTVALF